MWPNLASPAAEEWMLFDERRWRGSWRRRSGGSCGGTRPPRSPKTGCSSTVGTAPTASRRSRQTWRADRQPGKDELGDRGGLESSGNRGLSRLDRGLWRVDRARGRTEDGKRKGCTRRSHHVCRRVAH